MSNERSFVRSQSVDATSLLEVESVADVAVEPAPVGYSDISKYMPSMMTPYPDGTRVFARPYWYEELEEISQLKPEEIAANPVIYYERCLSGVEILGSGMASSELTLPDFLMVLLWRKVSTLDTKSFTIVTMEKDPVQLTARLQDIVFDEMRAPKLPIRATIGDEKGEFNPATVGSYIRHFRSTGSPPSEMDIQVMQFSGDGNAVRRATGKGAKTLKKVNDYLYHGLLPVKCRTKGGEERELVLDDPSNIVLPFREDDGSEELEIEFG